MSGGDLERLARALHAKMSGFGHPVDYDTVATIVADTYLVVSGDLRVEEFEGRWKEWDGKDAW